MADNDNMQTMLEWSNLLGDGKPTDEVTAAMLIARTALTPYADKEQIDCGMGFGEACLDFWMNGKAVRVVVSEVAGKQGDEAL